MSRKKIDFSVMKDFDAGEYIANPDGLLTDKEFNEEMLFRNTAKPINKMDFSVMKNFDAEQYIVNPDGSLTDEVIHQ